MGARVPYDRRVADRYGADVLANDPHESRKVRSTEQPVAIGMVVEDPQSGYVGAVVGVEGGRVELEDRRGGRRVFPLGPGFLLEGRPVILTAPRPSAAAAPQRTKSGSVKVADGRARVALASRIYVEGRHDAELVEQVWGDDLRVEGVVVEHLGGVDDLVDSLPPSARGRAGGSASWSTTSSRAPRRRGSPKPSGAAPAASPPWWSATRTSTSGRRSSQAGSDCLRGPTFRAMWSGNTGSVASWAGRTATRRTSPGRGSGSGRRCATGRTSSRR